MVNGQEHIDKLFSEKLTDFSRPPSEKVWQGIEKKLERNKKKKAIFFIQRIAASIILLLTIGGVYFYLSNERISSNKGITENPVINKKTQQEINPVVNHPVASTPAISEQQKPIKPEIIKNNTVPVEKRNDYLSEQMIDASTENNIVVDNEKGTEKIYPLKSKMSYVTIYSAQPIKTTTTFKQGGTLSEASIIAMNTEFDQKNKDIQDKWHVGGQFSPTYSYRNVVDNGGAVDNTASYYNNLEKPILAYSGGINIIYQSNNRLSIQSGIYYSKMGQAINNVASYSPRSNTGLTSNLIAVSNSLGAISAKETSYDINNQEYEVLNSPDKFLANGQLQDLYSLNEGVTFQQNLEFIEVPFILRYTLWDLKVDFHLLGGLSTNFLVGNNVYLKTDGEKEDIGKTSGIKTLNYSGIVGFGINYNFASRFSLSVEPAFKYYLNPINESSSLGYHPYSFGVYTGINYSF